MLSQGSSTGAADHCFPTHRGYDVDITFIEGGVNKRRIFTCQASSPYDAAEIVASTLDEAAGHKVCTLGAVWKVKELKK